MALRSMTGFATVLGTTDGVDWRWELRSLNSRGLDLRVRMPSTFEEIEAVVRSKIAKRLTRGSCQISLQAKRAEVAPEPKINKAVLDRLLEISARLEDEAGATPPSADGLLALKGVLDIVEPEFDETQRKPVVEEMCQGLDDALSALVTYRAGEGEKLEVFLRSQVDQIDRLHHAISGLPARNPEVHLERISAQITQMLGSQTEFSADRLHQEAALLATKADIREELDRLASHIEAARELFAEDKPAGRRLDFLSQEFNREANTICSKSTDIETTRLGLELKAVIDQFKEQVQNVE